MTDEVNAYLQASGAQAAKFAKIGDKIGGTIQHFELREQTDFKTGEPKLFPSGHPMQQIVVTLQTARRDDDDDDGLRRVYVKGQMEKALKKALGKQLLAVGGQLAVRYEADGEPAKTGQHAPKQYKVRYEAPALDVTAVEDEEEDEPLPFEDFE